MSSKWNLAPVSAVNKRAFIVINNICFLKFCLETNSVNKEKQEMIIVTVTEVLAFYNQARRLNPCFTSTALCSTHISGHL